MRFRWDKKYLYWGVTAFCVIAASIVFFLILSKISAIKGFFGIILKVIKPVLYRSSLCLPDESAGQDL